MNKANDKNQTSSRGLQKRMQDVYFEILPPVKETKENKTNKQ
jgi:hypothetical protein